MTASINEACARQARQLESSASLLEGAAFAAATAIKHGAVALGLIATSDVFDVRWLNMEIELPDEAAEIYDISRTIEDEAEKIVSGVDPTKCLARIAEQLKRLFTIADLEELDWAASVAVRFTGKAIERETSAVEALKLSC